MESLLIKVSLREERGKQNKKLRKNRRVPAVVYGQGQKNIPFSLDIRDAEKYSKKDFENKIFTFESEDKNLKGLKVIKKSVAYHKLSHLPIHIDFLSLDMNKPIRVPVDIRFKGMPKGVKEEGGVLNTVLRNVEMECLPNEIPAFIELDVSDLSLNESLHVSELNIPEKAKLITKKERTLCTVVSPEKEEEKPVEVAEATDQGTTASSSDQTEQAPAETAKQTESSKDKK